MKRRRKTQWSTPPLDQAGGAFLRGFVATALLVAIQDRTNKPLDSRRILRHAVQGGIALAAGTTASDAALRRDYGSAALAVSAGAAAIIGTELLLSPSSHKESRHGQEEKEQEEQV